MDLSNCRVSTAWARAGAVLLLWLTALSTSNARAANRDALRQIVQEQCMVHWLQQHSASPCDRIHLPDPPHEREGFAVLADRKGGAHFLLIPTKTIAGMESPELLEPGTPNYFAAAWQARDRVAAVVGHSVPRSAVGMALNPQHARTQDQLHIHVECVRVDIADALRSQAPRISHVWSPVVLNGSSYQALRIMGEELDGADPFALIADGIPAAKAAMGDYTVIVAGMDFSEGPGFVVLAGNASAGELLLDSTCAAARR